ncbi:hypothetical protein AVEN_220422-1, partial [Araneus ventricosus]
PPYPLPFPAQVGAMRLKEGGNHKQAFTPPCLSIRVYVE